MTGKYFLLQLKRLVKALIPALCIMAVLFGTLTAVYGEASRIMSDERSDLQVKMKIGMVGTVGDTYLELGMAALESLDSTRMSLEIVAMNEAEAIRAMERGDISAYITVPEGFVENALHGKILPLKYVGTSGAIGVVALMKDEITKVVDDIVVAAQKGIYGAGDAGSSVGVHDGIVTNISIEYVKFVFDRSDAYRVKYIGTDGGLSMEQYLLTGLLTLLLMLTCLPFAPMLVKREMSLDRMLTARMIPAPVQAAMDFAVYFIGLVAVLGVMLALVALFGTGAELAVTVDAIVHILPAVFMIASLSFMLYSLTAELISGVLLQFFSVLALGFVSGCMYPMSFFPESVQNIAVYLPTAMARAQMGGLINGEFSADASAALLVWGVAFLAVSAVVRQVKCAKVRG